MVTASAPAKLILCGEHAVVYGRHALAVPLTDIRATAAVERGAGAGVVFEAPDLAMRWTADTTEQPLAALYHRAAQRLGIGARADLVITLRSEIPIAAGMGSGAALGAALVRALAAYMGVALSAAEIAALVFESERYFHGTPSGIDNTVASYEQAICYVRGAGAPPGAPTIEQLEIGAPISLVVGDTGVRAFTRDTVGRVRDGWRRDPARFEALFDAIDEQVCAARERLALGDKPGLGRALDNNQALLIELGVSTPELDRLVSAARSAGALGAKLSGGGGGGVMFALIEDPARAAVVRSLYKAGAVRVLAAVVG